MLKGGFHLQLLGFPFVYQFELQIEIEPNFPEVAASQLDLKNHKECLKSDALFHEKSL